MIRCVEVEIQRWQLEHIVEEADLNLLLQPQRTSANRHCATAPRLQSCLSPPDFLT